VDEDQHGFGMNHWNGGNFSEGGHDPDDLLDLLTTNGTLSPEQEGRVAAYEQSQLDTQRLAEAEAQYGPLRQDCGLCGGPLSVDEMCEAASYHRSCVTEYTANECQ
jgi:hypothetical protein